MTEPKFTVRYARIGNAVPVYAVEHDGFTCIVHTVASAIDHMRGHAGAAEVRAACKKARETP